MKQNKFHVLDVKPEEEIYKAEPHKYLQAYQANTAYTIKKVLEYKRNDPKFKQ
jgi:hypothetical protein